MLWAISVEINLEYALSTLHILAHSCSVNISTLWTRRLRWREIIAQCQIRTECGFEPRICS